MNVCVQHLCRTRCSAGLSNTFQHRLFSTSTPGNWQTKFPSTSRLHPQHNPLRHHKRLPFSYLTIRMVEGHQCHRVGHAHRKTLLNKRFEAVSPNGRFADGAKAINQQVLSRIEVHGKNLFYFFGEGPSTVVMHVHFGMSGAFKTLPRGDALPEAKPTTRLMLVGDQHIGLLSAMFVAHGGLDFYEEKVAKLGPDPLREDADAELLWARMQRSKTPVGLILMQQDAVAGIGNIYRAEILFKAAVHPEQPGFSVDRAAFERIWRHSVELLQRGFKSGSILTVDPDEAARLGPPWQRRYIYNHKTCGRCGGAIRSWSMAARTCYACQTCQVLPDRAALSPQRSKALKAATGTKVFKSHCAPEPVENLAPAQLTIAELKAKLKGLGQPVSGRKAELVARVAAALEAGGLQEEAAVAPGMAPEAWPAGSEEKMVPGVAPGTSRLGNIATAEEAALEKARAGEGRDVEHVALETEGTLQLATARGAAAPRRNARRGGRAQGGKEAGAPAMVAAEPDSAVQAPASSGKLNLRKRKAAAAKGAAASAVRGGVKGKPRPAVGLDVPYTWGK